MSSSCSVRSRTTAGSISRISPIVARNSRAVRRSNSWSGSSTTPTAAARLAQVGARRRARTPRSMPASGRTSPITERSVVDLPLPFGPTSPKHDPAGTSRSSASSASVVAEPFHEPADVQRRRERWGNAAPPDIRSEPDRPSDRVGRGCSAAPASGRRGRFVDPYVAARTEDPFPELDDRARPAGVRAGVPRSDDRAARAGRPATPRPTRSPPSTSR